MAAIVCTQCGLSRGYFGESSGVPPCPSCYPPVSRNTDLENGTLATLTYLEHQEQSKESSHVRFPMEGNCLAKVLAAFPAIESTITDERRKKILDLVGNIQMNG